MELRALGGKVARDLHRELSRSTLALAHGFDASRAGAAALLLASASVICFPGPATTQQALTLTILSHTPGIARGSARPSADTSPDIGGIVAEPAGVAPRTPRRLARAARLGEKASRLESARVRPEASEAARLLRPEEHNTQYAVETARQARARECARPVGVASEAAWGPRDGTAQAASQQCQ
ncbi:hypothetical protein QAD02_012409 [Eretmocerus hayati]|uniref:Uncharacterized protein n=1 Tax=Eretmocerus hayati TaxID=131215 RepID=A0ACC2NZN0_9HYME|nr:hypothetical protein QAD02_012409 [Eretmocerus hayati]